MPPRSHTLADARRLVAWLVLEIGRELRLARLNAGLRQVDVGRPAGWSKSKVSRIERGRSPRVSFDDVALLAAIVGLRPSVRLYPTGRVLHDAGQVELLAALNSRLSSAWQIQTEVPMPGEGDLRAADQVLAIPGCRVMVEAYRRLIDYQAQSRSARLKQRDLGTERLLLLVEDTPANRRALREAADAVWRSYPVPARTMLTALAAGRDPRGDGVVLLSRRPAARARVASGATKVERTAPHRSRVPRRATRKA